MSLEDKPDNNTSPDGISSGHDLLVGQNNALDRVRYSRYYREVNDKNHTLASVNVTNNGQKNKDWIIPTGGGYFFAPSISTIKNIFGSFEK